MQFELMRFVMVPRTQMDAFERRDATGQPFDRESWLRDVFGDEITFNHRGSEYHYVPALITDYTSAPAESPAKEIIIGRVGRQIVSHENQPPAGQLAEIERETWRAELVLIDPRAHENGQMAAVEIIQEVGRPFAIMNSIAQSVNSRVTPESYYLDVNTIADPQTFWDFEKENRGSITSVSFELVAPNMFGIRTALDEELKELRDHENMRKATLEIQNDDGLKLQTERVEQTVSYTLEGGGALTARAKGGRRFNSRAKAKRQK